jgi:ABC-type hemin transport system substrate-binding protein
LTFPPRRIVCLTEETVETLYLLGEEARIVGVSRHRRVRLTRPAQVGQGSHRDAGSRGRRRA